MPDLASPRASPRAFSPGPPLLGRCRVFLGLRGFRAVDFIWAFQEFQVRKGHGSFQVRWAQWWRAQVCGNKNMYGKIGNGSSRRRTLAWK